ncbi:helix-turn-helix domain-containing protein [Methylotenera sp.]|uniref:helix-turn-helix domain-containing protein n=1 Tax=Methylotenera sp. TaxID=2051956 RepID=UPI00271A46C6|nr:helix-turn-helix transcriptional regulator [Methylotenera sp.]MDO9204214.1 helix-turn-helix transcriptional regulator [Methylotenera sp.]MDP2070351.1 helix-turn-helix transcriptional regulator [Methylotenera sp.]MDP3004566.1 helix-turn-helix transcriptional regulator [Methylotenera sp.]MDP3308131.1 helix-turn-helix transcriptional regulator [Methylotenera sp.]MDZ4212336.1 helix-turn-helix transcriptional regulator [Methylotenera sp.]
MSLHTVAIRLRQARERAGLSQKKLGILAGIDEFSASPRINQYERGKHVPDVYMVERLARVLRIPAIYMYCENEIMAEIILEFNDLSEEAQVSILQYAVGMREDKGS